MFRQLLRKEHICLELESEDRDGAIRELLSLGGDSAEQAPWSKRALKLMIEREERGTTAIGDGLAIPHCVLQEGLSEPFAAIGVSRKGLDYPALDGMPVHFIFLTVFPEASASYKQKDKILREAGFFFRDGFIQDQLRFAAAPDVVYDILAREAQSKFSGPGKMNFRRTRRVAQFAY